MGSAWATNQGRPQGILDPNHAPSCSQNSTLRAVRACGQDRFLTLNQHLSGFGRSPLHKLVFRRGDLHGRPRQNLKWKPEVHP